MWLKIASTKETEGVNKAQEVLFTLPPIKRAEELVHLETVRAADGVESFIFPSSLRFYVTHDVRMVAVFGWDMENLDGSWSVLQQAANASLTEAAGTGLSARTQLLLEILMVLMCVGAVTGRPTSFNC